MNRLLILCVIIIIIVLILIYILSSSSVTRTELKEDVIESSDVEIENIEEIKPVSSTDIVYVFFPELSTRDVVISEYISTHHPLYHIYNIYMNGSYKLINITENTTITFETYYGMFNELYRRGYRIYVGFITEKSIEMSREHIRCHDDGICITMLCTSHKYKECDDIVQLCGTDDEMNVNKTSHDVVYDITSAQDRYRAYQLSDNPMTINSYKSSSDVLYIMISDVNTYKSFTSNISEDMELITYNEVLDESIENVTICDIDIPPTLSDINAKTSTYKCIYHAIYLASRIHSGGDRVQFHCNRTNVIKYGNSRSEQSNS
jgi:hypothetical protein